MQVDAVADDLDRDLGQRQERPHRTWVAVVERRHGVIKMRAVGHSRVEARNGLVIGGLGVAEGDHHGPARAGRAAEQPHEVERPRPLGRDRDHREEALRRLEDPARQFHRDRLHAVQRNRPALVGGNERRLEVEAQDPRPAAGPPDARAHHAADFLGCIDRRHRRGGEEATGGVDSNSI